MNTWFGYYKVTCGLECRKSLWNILLSQQTEEIKLQKIMFVIVIYQSKEEVAVFHQFVVVKGTC